MQTAIQRLHTTVTHLASINAHNAHKAWQAQVCLSNVGNSCWRNWDSQMSSETYSQSAKPAVHTGTHKLWFSISWQHQHYGHFKMLYWLELLPFPVNHILFLLFLQPFPLVSSSRWMVKRGELTAFVEENGIFHKRMSRQQVYFFLFNDVLIVTRKKRWVCLRLRVTVRLFFVVFSWSKCGLVVQDLLMTHLFWHVEGESVTKSLCFSLCECRTAYGEDLECTACNMVFSMF